MPKEVMVIIIVGIVFSFLMARSGMRLAERKIALKEKMGESGADAALLADTQAELAKLKERVAVLERLITDEDRRLAGEISRLGGADVQSR